MPATTDSLTSSVTAPLLQITEARPQYTPQTYRRLTIPPNVSHNDFCSVLTDWNGTTERFDVDYNSLDSSIKAQRKKSHELGQGHYGEVYKITYRGVNLARKSIKIRGAASEEQVQQLREEATLGQKLDSHRHIVKLIGTYWKGDHHLNILIYPVAVCDLGRLLVDCQNLASPNKHQQDRMDNGMNDVRRRLDDLNLGFGLPPADDHLRRDPLNQRLRDIMGCTRKESTIEI